MTTALSVRTRQFYCKRI